MKKIYGVLVGYAEGKDAGRIEGICAAYRIFKNCQIANGCEVNETEILLQRNAEIRKICELPEKPFIMVPRFGAILFYNFDAPVGKTYHPEVEGEFGNEKYYIEIEDEPEKIYAEIIEPETPNQADVLMDYANIIEYMNTLPGSTGKDEVYKDIHDKIRKFFGIDCGIAVLKDDSGAPFILKFSGANPEKGGSPVYKDEHGYFIFKTPQDKPEEPNEPEEPQEVPEKPEEDAVKENTEE